MDVPGHVLTASVETSGATSIFDNATNHGGRASAFQLTDDTTVTFTNRYDQGELKLTKQLDGLKNQNSSTEEFTFTISIPEKWADEAEYNTGKYQISYQRDSDQRHTDGVIQFSNNGGTDTATAEIKLYPGETATITLPTGITPTITEKNVEGNYLVTWNEEGGSGDSFTAESITSGTPVTVTCVNSPATADITFRKVDESEQTKGLQGAEFLLYYEVEEEQGDKTTTYYYSDRGWVNDPDDATPITVSADNGIFEIESLKINTTYYLMEIKAPDGYKIPDKVIEINWKKDGTPNPNIGGAPLLTGKLEDTDYYIITNSTGVKLPETGGIGTTLVTIGGLMLMAAAVGGGYGLRRRRERRGTN